MVGVGIACSAAVQLKGNLEKVARKFVLHNDYNFVILSRKEAENRAAVSTRLLKWIGRSPVERAAAASFPV